MVRDDPKQPVVYLVSEPMEGNLSQAIKTDRVLLVDDELRLETSSLSVACHHQACSVLDSVKPWFVLLIVMVGALLQLRMKKMARLRVRAYPRTLNQLMNEGKQPITATH